MANFTTTSRIKFARMRAGQFLLAVTKYSAKRGIHFQNPAIELANPDSDRGRFKHRPKTQIAVIIACRRKLGDHVHNDTALKNFSLKSQRNKVRDRTSETWQRFQA